MKNKILTLICLATISCTSFAADNPKSSKQEDMIKFRQSAMMFMKWNVGRIKNQVVVNPQSFNKDDVLKAATAIAAIADDNLTKLFPADTRTGKGWHETKVKADYFNEPDKVKEYTFALVKEANKLVSVASAGDASEIKVQFNKMFESCKNCHKAFREK